MFRNSQFHNVNLLWHESTWSTFLMAWDYMVNILFKEYPLNELITRKTERNIVNPLFRKPWSLAAKNSFCRLLLLSSHDGGPTAHHVTRSVPSFPLILFSWRSFIFSNKNQVICIPLCEKTLESAPPSSPSLIPPTNHHGEPALKVPQNMVDQLVAPFKFALVGKFSHGHPSLERVRLIIAKFNPKSSFQLGHLDSKHMLIRLQHEGDFNRLWLKELWYVNSFSMRVFRGSPNFRSEIKSFIVPIWVSLPPSPSFSFQ